MGKILDGGVFILIIRLHNGHMWKKKRGHTDMGCAGGYNDVGYAAKRIPEECSIMGCDGIQR
jgi:hypothetical protein